MICRAIGGENPADLTCLDSIRERGTAAVVEAAGVAVYNPVAAVARDRRGAKLRDEQAADGVGQIGADAGLVEQEEMPTFRLKVSRAGITCQRYRICRSSWMNAVSICWASVHQPIVL